MQRLFYAESGFILFPITAISKLLRLDEPDRHLSPMDMFLDLWFHGTVCDPYTAGSVLMPVVHLELNQKVYKECMENEKILDPRVHLDDLAVRWNCSKSTVSRRLGTFVSDGLLGIYETHPACLESQGMLLVLPDIATGIFPDGGMWYKIRFCLIRKRQSLRWRSQNTISGMSSTFRSISGVLPGQHILKGMGRNLHQ